MILEETGKEIGGEQKGMEGHAEMHNPETGKKFVGSRSQTQAFNPSVKKLAEEAF